jgi:hypothetical protein
MLTETQDNEEIIARVAALDIGKADLVCCARVPHEGRTGRRLQEVETYSTMTRSLLGMAGHLRCLGVTRVVMEATSDYWKPALPAGGSRVRDLAGQRQGGQAPAGAPEDRPGRRLAGQGRRAADDPAEFRAAACVPAAAGCHPLPR